MNITRSSAASGWSPAPSCTPSTGTGKTWKKTWEETRRASRDTFLHPDRHLFNSARRCQSCFVADAGEFHPAVVPVDQTSHQLLALSPNNLTHSEGAGALWHCESYHGNLAVMWPSGLKSISFVHCGFNNLITGSHDLEAVGGKNAQFSINIWLLTFTNICPIFFTLQSFYNSVPGYGTLPLRHIIYPAPKISSQVAVFRCGWPRHRAARTRTALRARVLLCACV